MAKKMEWYGWAAYILLIVGALNWGLVGWFKFNLVDSIFGVRSVMSIIVYSLVAMSGIYALFTIKRLK